MNVSIIIPNYESPIIGETLESLMIQRSRHPYEIIVVGVDSAGIVHNFSNVVFIDTVDKCPPAKARNLGANRATGDYLIFLDADCITPPDWIDQLLEPFSDPSIIAVGGGVTFPPTNYWTMSDNLSMFYSFLSIKKARFTNQLASLNFAIKKTIYLNSGGFDERYMFPSSEDIDFSLRLSSLGKLYFHPGAWIIHKPPRNNLRSLLRHAYIQGKYSTKVDHKYKGQVNFPFRNKTILIMLAPILGLGATIRVFSDWSILKDYFFTIPAIFIAKISWCIGASQSPWLMPDTGSDV